MSFDSIKICISNIFSNVLETHPLLQLWIVLVLRKVTCYKGRLEDQAPSENLTEFSKITPLWSRHGSGQLELHAHTVGKSPRLRGSYQDGRKWVITMVNKSPK